MIIFCLENIRYINSLRELYKILGKIKLNNSIADIVLYVRHSYNLVYMRVKISEVQYNKDISHLFISKVYIFVSNFLVV